MSPEHQTAPAVSLVPENLDDLHPAIDVPAYDRDALVPAVVHIGVGGFHRAHQAVYFDGLARSGRSLEWGLVGTGLNTSRMRDALVGQDNLYAVVERGPETDRVRVVGVVTDYLYAPDDPSAVLDRLSDERTRLVTLTITGTSYPSGDLDPEDPDVQADVSTPATPATAFGFIVEALDRRRRAGTAPFTVLSCDNLQHNGAVTKAAVLATARLRDAELAAWIEENVTFPSSMVDRITPETTPEERAEIAREHGLDDTWPVITEPFSQWIVEDDFCNGRPPLEEVGVQFVGNVGPYEVMKTRLLNGSHCALSYLGHLAGFRTSDEAMADPRMRTFVEGYLDEAAALLAAVPGIDLQAYRATLVERFSNARLGDGLDRLARRGSTKVPTYVLPSLRQALDQNRPRRHLVLTVAAWLRYLRGTDYAGTPIDISDAEADRLSQLARAGGTDPLPFLEASGLFGSLADSTRLAAELTEALQSLEEGPLEAAARLRPQVPVTEARGSAA
jgi:mannitol 2-dehydrogenase